MFLAACGPHPPQRPACPARVLTCSSGRPGDRSPAPGGPRPPSPVTTGGLHLLGALAPPARYGLIQPGQDPLHGGKLVTEEGTGCVRGGRGASFPKAVRASNAQCRQKTRPGSLWRAEPAPWTSSNRDVSNPLTCIENSKTNLLSGIVQQVVLMPSVRTRSGRARPQRQTGKRNLCHMMQGACAPAGEHFSWPSCWDWRRR